MNPPNLTPEYIDIRDEQTPQRDGSVLKQKRITFYLGKYGPFIERFDLDSFDMSQVPARIQALQQQVRGLHMLQG